MPQTVWAYCGLDQEYPVYGAFDELGECLRKKDITLMVFTRASVESERGGFLPIQAPLSIAALPGASKGTNDDAPTMRELKAIEHAWGFPADLQAIANGMDVWDAVADLTQPCAILSWHTTPPISHLHRRIADRRRTPWWSLELGPLPQTLDLSFGQVFRSNLTSSITMRRGDYRDDDLEARITGIRSYYGELAERHYPENNRLLPSERMAALVGPPGPKILFIGSFDPACGVALSPPHAAPGAGERCSPYVGSSQDALDRLAAALAAVAPGATIWVRPHPGHTLSLDAMSALGLKAELTAVEDLVWLMRQADVSACMASNAQLQLALWGKPQISFASGYLASRDVAYDVRSDEELRQGLIDALAGVDWASRERRGKEAIALLFDRQLVGMKNETPTHLRISDFADLIAGCKGFSPPIQHDGAALVTAVQELLKNGLPRQD